MRLYGRDWTRRELEARAGHGGQLFGVRRLRLAEGPGDGLEQIEVRTGAGLRFLVSPHRGLDISLAEYAGTPFSWQSPNGDVHPSYFRHEEWLRTAVGGLLMTCGYTQVGAPCIDDGEDLGIHGRAHHTAATNVSAWTEWHGDDCVINICGTIRETRFFREKIEVSRFITCNAGDNTIRITDEIRNAGFQPVPLMVLYHFNLGYPLLAENTGFRFPSRSVKPRDAGTPETGFDRWQTPDPSFHEQVYYHSDFQTRSDEALGPACAEVFLARPDFPVAAGTEPLTLSVKWDTRTLPNLIQWKMAGAVDHVMGIEPANCLVDGRKAERERGTLVMLEPGETQTMRLAVGITPRR